MVRKRGLELLHHVDNTQLADFASGPKAQMPHNLASIVRLLYGERTAEEKAAEVFSLQSCQEQFDIRASDRSRATGQDLRRGLQDSMFQE